MPDAGAPHGHSTLKLIERILSPEKIPGLVGFAFTVLLQIASWKGAIDLYMPALQELGGAAMPVADFVFSPGFSITLALASGFYLWFVSSANQTALERREATLAAWMILTAFAIPVITVTLFGYFLISSHIPSLVDTVEQRLAERSLSEDQATKLYNGFRGIAGKTLPIDVAAARSPEALNYARQIFQIMKSAGVDLNDTERARAVDLDNTSERGLIVFARDNAQSRDAAAMLRDSFAKARIATDTVVSNDTPDKLIELFVAYH